MTKSAKRTIVRCVSILLVLLMLLSLIPFSSFAAELGTEDSNVVEHILTGEFEGQFELSSEDSVLFHLEDILPGDSWTGQIHIINKAPGEMAVNLRSITSDIEDMTLFSELYLNISSEGEELYSGSYNTGLTQITPSFKLDSKETLVLDVEVRLPHTAGNYVQGGKMDSTWTFEAVYTERPQTGDNLVTENTLNGLIIWIILLSLLAAIVVTFRIRAVVKAQKKDSKEGTKK